MPQRLLLALTARRTARTRTRTRTRTALLAVLSTVAALTSVAAVGSAPASAATGCGSYSTLDCSAVAPTLPLTLGFTADAGGYAATGSGSVGTGFTMDQPSSNGGSYLPAKLTENTTAPGTLTVNSTVGSAYLTSSSGGNSLDNGLGVGVDAADKTLTVATTVTNVPTTKNAGEGQGLWFGPDEDNYLKLGFVATSGGLMKPQLAREVAGASTSATDERNGTAVNATGGSAVFTLVIDPVKLTATATYTFQGTAHTIGTLTIPSSFVDGSTLSTPIPHATSFTGIYASERRNTSVATGLPFVFDAFSVSGTDIAAPPAPAAPTASQAGGGVGLSWPADAAKDVVGYNVYRSTTSTVSTTGTPLNGSTPISGLSYTDPTATAGSTYYYALTAVDDAGKVSPASAAVSISTSGDRTPPDAPTALSATAGTGDIRLSWTASQAADTAGYRVYRSTSTPVSTTGTPLNGSTLLTSTTYDDPTVASSTNYSYVVVALDSAGNVSTASNTVTAHVVDVTPPAAPTGVKAVPASGAITLTWTPNTESDLAGYSVYRSSTPTVAITSANVVSGSALLTTPTFTNSGLAPGATFYYVLVAVDTSGNVSGASPVVSATTFTATNTGVLSVTNLDALANLPMPYRMVFNRIQSPVDANQAVHDTATTRLGNTGTAAITVTALTLTGPYALVGAPTLPATIAPGGTLDVTIRFTASTGGSKGSQQSGSLAISSNAGTNPSPSIDLEGWWQALSEHSLEPLLPDLKSMFGLNVTLPAQIDEAGEYKAFSTDEILSPYWRRLDPSKPVTVNEIAAYHTYPTANYLQWFTKGATTFSSFSSSGRYQAQSVLPRTAATTTPTAPSSGSINPTGAFGIKVDAEYGDAALNGQSTDRGNGCTTTLCGSHVRAFQLHNADGSLLTGSYLIVEDAGGVNYDYNDNVYVMNNVQPEATGIPTGVSATSGNAQSTITWSPVSGSDVKGYNVYSATGGATPSGTSTPLNGSTLLTGTSYTATGLANLTAYTFAVQTVYQNGARSDLSAAAAATPHDPSKFSAAVNFQSAAADVPAGYDRDYGQAYGARSGANQGTGLTYGWVVPDTTTPRDLSVGGSGPGNGRDRNVVTDQRYDTLMYMQAPSTFDGTRLPGSWEMSVPNGTYQVLVAVGDPLVSGTASNMVINVEGKNAITGFNPTGANGSATTHTSATVTVTVTDGRLTVDADGGTNTRIDFVQINQM